MSSYKPKVFRSQDGCCICRAKSSSSRFTVSDKYSDSFHGCFQLSDDDVRTGEICNACVLIVKRWKKLPASSTKNWAHVVDARSGPGSKTLMRPRKKEEEENLKYKHVYHRKHVSSNKPVPTRRTSAGSSRSGSPDNISSQPSSSSSSSSGAARLSSNDLTEPSLYPGFLDSHYWRRTIVCCGVIFVGQLGEVMIDKRYYKSCCENKEVSSQIDDVPEDLTDSVETESYGTVESKEFYASEHDKKTEEDKSIESSHIDSDSLDEHMETFTTCV